MPFFDHESAIANIESARFLLGFNTSTPLTKKTLRDQFRKTVTSGHSDRGGGADIQKLCDARDFLQTILKKNEKSAICAECVDSICAYHRVFPV